MPAVRQTTRGRPSSTPKSSKATCRARAAHRVNLKLLLEGEEEIGSKNLNAFIQANRELLKADAVVISDTGMIDPDQPAITVAVRGLTLYAD